MMDRPRSWETPAVRCFLRPLLAPLYKHHSGWKKYLDLPMEVAATVEDNIGQEIELVNGLGEKWPVILTAYDGTPALGRGWEAFVDRHELEEFDLLVFRSINRSYFRVEVYSGLCGEKICSRPPSVARFFKPLDQSNCIKRLVLPPDISAIVEDKIGQETMLENAFGEQWMMRFSSYNGLVAFGTGWKEFANYHNLVERDILVFRGFNKGSLFEVEVYSGMTFCEKACRGSLIRAREEEHSKGKRRIGTSFEHPNVDLGSPLKGEHSKGKRKLGTSFESPSVDLGSPLKGVEQVADKGTRSRPQETNNVNQVETESSDDLSGPAVTCLAVTSGSELVIPGLPPLTDYHRKRGAVNVIKNYLLMDEESGLWPASYHAETDIVLFVGPFCCGKWSRGWRLVSFCSLR